MMDNSSVLLAIILGGAVGIFAVSLLIFRKMRGVPVLTLGTIKASSDDREITVANADVVLSPASESDAAEEPDSNHESLLRTFEPVLSTLPAFSTVLASANGLFRVSFSPEVTKGISDGSFTLMKANGGLRAVATDSSGRVVGHGTLSPDRVASSVAVAAAVWQIMAVVTAQKFLADINARLASIEDGVRRLEAWLREHEQGQFLGNMRYLNEVALSVSRGMTIERASVIQEQIESVYRQSLQALEANALRASTAFENLKAKSFDGSLKENEAAFRREMDAYFEGISYVVRFRYVAATSSYLGSILDRSSLSNVVRVEAIVRDAEALLANVKTDCEEMKKRASQISGGFWDSESSVKARRKTLKKEVDALVLACEESTSKVQGVAEATRSVGRYVSEVESQGFDLIIELQRGSLKTVRSARKNKTAG